jgi:hypothetical protein
LYVPLWVQADNRDGMRSANACDIIFAAALNARIYLCDFGFDLDRIRQSIKEEVNVGPKVSVSSGVYEANVAV